MSASSWAQALRLDAAAGWLAGLAGWRRAAAAAALGALATTALPPLGLVPAAFLAFTGLLWQLDGAPTRRAAFAVGWWFGVGHFLTGTYWISESLLVEPDRFAWLIPFCLVGVSAYLALYPALAATVAVLVRRGPARVLALAAAWTGLEMVRGVVLSGFPWNPIGSVWTGWPAMIQLAAVLGVFGLGFVTVLLAGAPALLAAPRRAGRLAAFGVPLALAVLWGGGALRLAGASEAVVPGVRLGIVQPAIPQIERVRGDARARHFVRHLRMTARDFGPAVTAVIWPEAAVEFVLSHAPQALAEIARVLPKGRVLITGAIRATPRGVRPVRVWNGLDVVDDGGRIVAGYDKAHLVPFGEYVPWRAVLGLTSVAASRYDFSFGPGPRTLRVAGLPPFSPLICYEIIFPGHVTEPGHRPAWLLNLTNDSWFGMSAGPYQHFAAARMRAVEEGLPVVRAANAGISAVIDPYGRVVARLGLGRSGVLEAALPAALAGPTPFARFGNWPVIALVTVSGLVLALAEWRKRRTR